VGKTNILMRFVQNDFNEKSQMTIGSAFQAKVVKYKDNILKYLVHKNLNNLKNLSFFDFNFKLILFRSGTPPDRKNIEP
jgi:GTPase SAR1 family protein